MGIHEINKLQMAISLEEDRKRLESIRSADFAQIDDTDCECIHLDGQIEQLIEHDAPWQLTDNACGPLNPPDEIEETLQLWITKLKNAGYYDEDAERAVFDAFEGLIEGNYISDTPDYDAPKPVKLVWIERFNTQVRMKLIAMGIELNG